MKSDFILTSSSGSSGKVRLVPGSEATLSSAVLTGAVKIFTPLSPKPRASTHHAQSSSKHLIISDIYLKTIDISEL